MSIIDRLFARVPVFINEVEVSESVQRVLDNADMLRFEIQDAMINNSLEKSMRDIGVFRSNTK